MIHIFLKIIAIVALGFFAIVFLMFLLQEKMIFFQPKEVFPEAKNFTAHKIIFKRNQIILHGWWVKKLKAEQDKPLIIYYGGNAEEVSCNLSEFQDRGFANFLLVNYRGYGQSSGNPTETDLCEDAIFIFDQMVSKYFVDPHRIVLMGRSLGSGVAVHVASLRDVGGVILITPFDSLVNVAKIYYPFLPIKYLMRHRFESVRQASKIRTPLLALIAGQDEIIPNESSQKLVAKWGAEKRSVVIPDAGHNDIHQYRNYWQAIEAFIASVRFDQSQ